MKHKSETFPFAKGSFLELKHSSDLLVCKVTGIDAHHNFIGESKIHMKLLLAQHLGKAGHITWDFQYLMQLLTRVIESPTELRLIRLLYD